MPPQPFVASENLCGAIKKETADALLFWRRFCPDATVRIINPDAAVREFVLKTQSVNGLWFFSLAAYPVLPFSGLVKLSCG